MDLPSLSEQYGAMERRGSFDDSLNDQAIPIPIQIFLWRQTSPFIRPKLGKLHESSCLFCLNAPGHHELKEACKSFEKVLVQNIQFGLSPSLTEAIRSIPRWRLVQASFPHVMHCAAALLSSRRDNNLQNLSAAETKLLYTLHWIILDAAEECANDDFEKDIFHSSPFYYLFSIPSITVFIFLFAPLCHLIKESDLQSFRLENGMKLWQPIWEYKHPEARCFTAHCKPKPRTLSARGRNLPQARGLSSGDFFPGAKRTNSEEAAYQNADSPPSASLSDPVNGLARSTDSKGSGGDDESAWVSSPKESNFPETIPEESSSTEEEHMVIFKLPSLSDSEGLKESSIYSADASIFQVPMGRNSSSSPRGILNIEQVTAISGSDTRQYRPRPPQLRTDIEASLAPPDMTPVSSPRHKVDLTAATFMDVAVLRCLFLKNWQEEGVYWALQFLYHRLREISDETTAQQLPRRRSNSLPIPKIEVSIYQSPELKKRESRVFIDVPDDTSLIGKKQTLASSDGEQVGSAGGSHSRRSSEKVKKRMKMADLKAFVETKLLSKSEKTLEKIGQDESKSSAVFDQNRSLDAGDETPRPCSALAKMLDPHKTESDRSMKPLSNLVKGKSMPSLSCLIDELASAGYIGESCGDRGRQHRPAPLQLQPVPHPIITVTEHTPTPSPDYTRRPEHGSVDSQLDALSLQGSRSGGTTDRKPSLTRSQTDSNITYTKEEVLESPGSVCYITRDGDIDYQVVLKAVYSVSVRDTTCTLRVCEVILNLVELLMELGVLKVPSKLNQSITQASTVNKAERTTPAPMTPGPSSSHQQYTSRGPEDIELGEEEIKTEVEISSAHGKLINCVVRVLKQLGCPQGCGDGARGPPADFLRSQGQTLLSKLHRASQKQFSRFFRIYVRRRPVGEVLDFFHAYLGFCVDPGSLLSPLNQKRSASKSPDIGCCSASGYSTNFGAGLKGGGSRGIEGHIVACVFKTLISRLIRLRELKNQENINLYCDIRQLIIYVREAHGGTFRRVALSALLDSSSRPHKKEPSTQTTRVIRTSSQIHIHADSAVSLLETETGGEETALKTSSQSPLSQLRGGRKQHPPHLHVLTPRHSERTLGIESSATTATPTGKTGRKTSSKFLGGWFKKDGSGRTESTDSHDGSDSPIESSFMRQPSIYYLQGISGSTQKHPTMGSQVGQTLQKARRKMEDQLNKIGIGKGKKKDGGPEETPGGHLSRRNSLETGEHARESEFVVLKERKLVPILPVYNGSLRFQFLLDTCHPGTVPDPHLLSSLLDLPHAPVVAKASLLLECAFFVHNCNKGQWPTWMKLNIPMFRPSVPLSSRSAPSGLRRSHMLQRAAGKMFYQWAEALGARLEEMISQDKQHVNNVVAMVTDETRQKELLLEDEEEDFLDEASIGLMGLQCPIALRMIACLVLLEVTSFLRETYQALPKCSRLSSRDRPPAWERMYSRAGPGAMPGGVAGTTGGDTNRRWSMALSSMGHSQTSAQSLQSIAGDKDNGAERKISFVLHEPDNESEGSSNTTVTMQGEDAQSQERRERERVALAAAAAAGGTVAAGSSRAPPPRPFLLRRGTNAGTPGTAGSFKRRSLKLRRNTKDATSSRSENESTDSFTATVATSGAPSTTVRRTDSIQSKRKVSSLSDRSDTSDHGDHAGGGGGEAGSGGEESPGVLSDEQPPESPSDSNDTDDGCITKNLPWMKTAVLISNSFNFYCTHQGFCHPFCYRRHMRACSRLIKSVRKVYGEQFGVAVESRVSERERTFLRDEQSGGKKDKGSRGGRKVSDQASSQTSPIRRKDSLGKKERVDSKLVRDSSRDIAEDGDISGANARQHPASINGKDIPSILKYIKSQAKDVFHAPLSVLVKGAVILNEDHFIDILPVAWELLLEPGQEVAAAAATLFILAAVRAPSHASDVMHHGLQHADTATRINAILRFQVLWKFRYQVWPRMEEGAYLNFKVPPPGIEFTLPSPKIGIESLPVVDPPWMPQVKTKVEEVTISQESHRSLVTATKTRKKQQTELIKLALQAEEDKKRQEREDFLITTIPITFQAAYEPSLYHAAGEDHDDGDEEQTDTQMRGHMVHAAHSLFPSCLCSAVIQIINLLDDAAVTSEGSAVYEVAYQVIWTCLVEDSALFLRYVLERLTRERQDLMFKILRHLIRFVPKLPQQAAFALYNYIIGYIMFYVRTPHEDGQTYIGTALSILWMVVHSVHGIMFKDLKQILRKEQCDASILLTANVPSAKKIIVHGPQEPDVGGIPSQFPVQEDTQFCQILRESLDFFGIDESRHKEFFLVDHKTHQIHNPSAYVRDFYFFKRSQYPQLQLVHMQPDEAYNALQRRALTLKFVEIGKVMLTWAILKNVDMVVQRVVFLHEELMKLPSFPRKALESDLDLYKGGELGKELLGLDMMHKFMWVRLIARMFEAMAGNFAYSGDIHLFLNVLNGSLILHSEDACLLRYVTATYINAASHFKNIFSTNGYLLIMPTLLQIYSNHQTNKLVTRTVEYTVKQFYLLNRKPFILQMFGSVSAILDTDEDSQFGDAHKVQPNCLFNLLLSLETPSPDPLNIGELVREEKPLKPIDFCYRDENEMVTVLDCISLCVMVVAYAADSLRGQQMLTILEAILPCYLQHIQQPWYRQNGKSERDIIAQLAVAIKTLVNNCEALSKNYTGPQKASPDHKGSSQRNYRSGPYSPGFEFDEDSHSKYMSDHSRTKMMNDRDLEDSEVLRNEFRRPRDILLSMVADFLTKCTSRVAELNKRSTQDGKPIEMLDAKAHVRLSEIAHSLLKVSPYDPDTMGCRGLQRYMNDLLPSTEWANESMRPALIAILRRLDKTFSKIYKKPSIRRHTDWDAAAGLLKGIYETLSRYPYIVHMQHLKTLMNTCQALIVGDAVSTGIVEGVSSATAALMSQVPPPHFCSTVVRLIALQILAIGETYSLEQVCGGSSVFPTHAKTETMLMNLLMPLCLRVGSGRKDVPRMRQADISFALTIVLHAMNPPATKTSPVTAQNIKSASELRAGSVTYGSREASNRAQTIPTSLYRVAFLALRIMLVAFERELVMDWPRIARTIQEMGRRNEGGILFWEFLDFVVTQRCPLFILLTPFILQNVLRILSNEQEREIQVRIRDKMYCINLPVRKAKGALLLDLAHEMKEVKEEMEDRKFEEADRKMAEEQPLHRHRPSVHHRPSIIELFTGGDLGRHSTALTVDTGASTLAPPHSILHREVTSFTAHEVRPSLQRLYSATADAGSTGGESEGGESVPSESLVEEEQPATAPVEASQVEQPTERQQQLDESPCRVQTPTTDRLHNSRPKASKLRFVPSVEFRHSSGETSITPLSPGSPVGDDSGSEHGRSKPRLQRSKAQSRKTFRLRKSRKSRIEVSHIKVEPPPPLGIAVGETSQNSGTPLELSVTATLTPPSSATSMPPPCSPLGLQRRGGSTRNKLHREISYEEDSAISHTSSTSGYRESFADRHSLLMLESPPTVQQFSPPLASPDIHDLPSTSSASQTAEPVRHPLEQESSAESLNSGEDTALLPDMSITQPSSLSPPPHHPLLALFDHHQDEDTLL